MGQITNELANAQTADAAVRIAPWGINLITHRTNPRLQADIDLTVKYKTPLAITSLGSPGPAIEAVHSYALRVGAGIIKQTLMDFLR